MERGEPIYHDSKNAQDPQDQGHVPENAEYSCESVTKDVRLQIYQKLPLEFIPRQGLRSQLKHILKKTQNLVYFGKGWCLILLKDFNWNYQQLNYKLFEDYDQNIKKAGIERDLYQPTDQEGDCEVCSKREMLYGNICGHRYCIWCWKAHLENCIDMGSLFPKCMNDDCKKPVLLETVERVLKMEQLKKEGVNLLKRYWKKLCESFISNNPNYQFCPGVDCDYCLKNEPGCTLNTVKCRCGKLFCFNCQGDDHYPAKCKQQGKALELAKLVNEEANAGWISKNTKQCPSCRTRVERSMGCNFMECRCRKNFCYMCQQPWEPYHNDHYKCQIYQKKRENPVYCKPSAMEEKIKIIYGKILASNQQAVNLCKKIDVVALRRYLFETIQIRLADSELIEKLHQVSTQYCDKLKQICFFVFSKDYELRENPKAFLGEYESHKKTLLAMLTENLNSLFFKIQRKKQKGKLNKQQIKSLRRQFDTLKKQIVNQYTFAKGYKNQFEDQLKRKWEESDEKEYEEHPPRKNVKY